MNGTCTWRGETRAGHAAHGSWCCADCFARHAASDGSSSHAEAHSRRATHRPTTRTPLRSLKRSKAVNGSRAVVGVVGKGHMRGVVYALRHDSGALRFADLVGGANRKRQRQRDQLVRLAVELLLGAGAWGLWVQLSGGGGGGGGPM